jgi:hypothetical protein
MATRKGLIALADEASRRHADACGKACHTYAILQVLGKIGTREVGSHVLVLAFVSKHPTGRSDNSPIA